MNMIAPIKRYCFSGHETFYCKSLWLKKGYDFRCEGNAFTQDDAVVKLGVGKNMVSSIRFWLKTFGLTVEDNPTDIANIVLHNDGDPFLEDNNTLWLLHYLLVSNKISSVYNLLFVEYQREKKEFDRELLQNFIKRRCNVPEQKNVYNENTVKKDIGVLLHNYLAPKSLSSVEDFTGIMIGLNLLRRLDNRETYVFNEITGNAIDNRIILFAILDTAKDDTTISFHEIQDLALTFGMSLTTFIDVVRKIEAKYPKQIHYSETSGVRNIQFTGAKLDKYKILRQYYQ